MGEFYHWSRCRKDGARPSLDGAMFVTVFNGGPCVPNAALTGPTSYVARDARLCAIHSSAVTEREHKFRVLLWFSLALNE